MIPFFLYFKAKKSKMKNTNSNFLFILAFLFIGCSSSKKISFKRNLGSKDKIVYYHIKTKSNKNSKYETLIENKFRELENLKLPFVEIYYNKKENIKIDCEINIVFDSLSINNASYSQNKSFSKVIKQQQLEADGTTSLGSETIRGYTYQRIKERKLNWIIHMNTLSTSNNCEISDITFTENFKSKSINNILSGDERAISEKYKNLIDQPLFSEREMIEVAINNVYKKIVSKLKNQ